MSKKSKKEVVPQVVPTPAKAASDSESDDEEVTKPTPTPTPKPAAPTPAADESDSEDETPAAPKPQTTPALPVKAPAAAAAAESSDDDDETPAPAAVPVPVAPAPAAEEESSDDEATPQAKPVPAVAPAAAPAGEESSDEDETPAAPAPVAPAEGGKKRKLEEEKQESSKKTKKDKQKKRKEVVSEEAQPEKKVSNGETEENTEAFVKGLSFDATEDDVREFFKECGTIKKCNLPSRPDGKSKGIAFVEFETKEGLDNAIAKDGETHMERYLNISQSSGKKPDRNSQGPVKRELSEKPEGCTTVFVGNLSWSVDDDTLRGTFEECGEIVRAQVSTDQESGKSRGFGHVEFSSPDGVDKAIALTGTDIGGRPIRVDYAGGGGRGGRGGRGGGDRGRGRGRGRGGDRGRGRGRGRGGDRGRGGRGRGRGGDRGRGRGRGGAPKAEGTGKKVTL